MSRDRILSYIYSNEIKHLTPNDKIRDIGNDIYMYMDQYGHLYMTEKESVRAIRIDSEEDFIETYFDILEERENHENL